MPSDAPWNHFSTIYIDPATGYPWMVDCLGASSWNQLEAESCVLQFQHGETVRYSSADPSNLDDPKEISGAFKRASPRPPKRQPEA
jgi:hypothetical protein